MGLPDVGDCQDQEKPRQTVSARRGVSDSMVGAMVPVRRLVRLPPALASRIPPALRPSPCTTPVITILKNGVESSYYVKIINLPGPTALDPLIVAGPATIRLISSGQGTLATFRLTPEAFPPDRTMLIPPGTNQVRLALECSTNLVEWFPATNGVYGPLPVAKFFRIKLDPFLSE